MLVGVRSRASAGFGPGRRRGRCRASAREVSGVGEGGVGGVLAPPMEVGGDVRLRRLSLCLRACIADGSHPIGRIASVREDCT